MHPDAPTTPVGVTCAKCQYDLRGLDPNDVCPECGYPVRISAWRRSTQVPRWVRMLRSAYIGAWLVIVSSPYLYHKIPQSLGLPTLPSSHAFLGWMFACTACTFILGVVLLLQYQHSRWAILIALSLLPLMCCGCLGPSIIN